MLPFQRARQPDQKTQRRDAILAAAADLFDAHPLDAIRIDAIAQRAGIAKGSVYSYFATKETIFLHLLMREVDLWCDDLIARLAPLPSPVGADTLCDALLDSLRDRDRLLRLLARLASDLEPALSAEDALTFKRWLLARMAVVGVRVELAAPWLAGQGARTLLRLHALIAGLWPMAHPRGPMRDVLARPEMAPLRVDLWDELHVLLLALLRAPR